MSPSPTPRSSRASTTRGTGRSGDTPRARAASRRGQRARAGGSQGAPSSASSATSATERPTPPRGSAQQAAAPRPGTFVRRLMGLGWLQRLLAVGVVLAMLAIPYASSLSVYLRQEREIAVARQQIAERQSSIGSLQDEIKRWNDPNYVRAQARSRLGWVVPGETGYRVIGPDGKPLGGGAQIDTEGALPSDEHAQVWWERLTGSIKAADQPAPKEGEATPTAPTTIKPTDQPTPTPTPRR
ncbi:FtsB family cell division protein [Aestuariimicrobium soli]|uniref:FtsB family cell division protein n=1 Tax=Aestuariimicrobium soli TaxID=2035834 RepID=UPI003EBD52D0